MIVTSLCDSGLYRYRPHLPVADAKGMRSAIRLAHAREIEFHRQLTHLRSLVFISILFDRSIVVPEGWAITCLPLLKIAGELWGAYRQLDEDDLALKLRLRAHYQTTEFPVRVGYFLAPSGRAAASGERYAASGENKEAFLQMYLRRLHPSATAFYGVDPLNSRSHPDEATENRTSLCEILTRFLKENPPAYSQVRAAAIDAPFEERLGGIAFQTRLLEVLDGDDEYLRGIQALAAFDRNFPAGARFPLADRRQEEARDMARIFQMVGGMDPAAVPFGQEAQGIVARLLAERPDMGDREMLRTKYLSGVSSEVAELLVDLGRIAVHSNNFVGAGVPVTMWEPYPHPDQAALRFILSVSESFARSQDATAGMSGGQSLRVVANAFDKAVAIDHRSEDATANWIEFWERVWALRLSEPWVALRRRLEAQFGGDDVLRQTKFWEELFHIFTTMNDVVWINREGYSGDIGSSAFFSVQLRRPARILEGAPGLGQDVLGSLLESAIQIFFPMSVLVRVLPISRKAKLNLLRWYGNQRLEALQGAFDVIEGMNPQSVTVSKQS